MAKILLIEDDKDLSLMICEWLSAERHLVEAVADGREGLDRLLICDYDLVILDLKLPGLDGMSVLKGLRASGKTTPALILTGQRSIEEKEEGFDSGADDYLTKPFNMRELSARVRALVRRSAAVPANTLKVRDLELDPVKHMVTRAGTAIQLMPREFALLEFLMRHPDVVFSGESLVRRVWHSDSEVTADAVRTYIMRLRQKIDRQDDRSMIETIPRIGYRLRGT